MFRGRNDHNSLYSCPVFFQSTTWKNRFSPPFGLRGIVKIGCSVCSSVRSCQSWVIFTKRNVGVVRCLLAVRFWNTGFETFCKKRVEVLLSKQNEKIFWSVFCPLFWPFLKKVETSHFSSQPLRARAVRYLVSFMFVEFLPRWNLDQQVLSRDLRRPGYKSVHIWH